MNRRDFLKSSAATALLSAGAATERLVFQLGTVNAVNIGYKSPAEIDEAIENVGLALNTRGTSASSASRG